MGLAPFQCHKPDCSPAHLATVTSTWSQSADTVTIRHYGNVTWTGMPYLISWCENDEDCTPGVHNDTDNWEVRNSPGTRAVVLGLETGQSLGADRHYHFFPVRAGANMLKCVDLTAAGNIPVADYDYRFIYEP